ncbi:TPA: DNA cytosine methyltransferase [Vibrio diabolicus]
MIEVNYNALCPNKKGLDLFCGAGGLSLGFMMAGGLPVGAIDIDEDAISTYRSLFPMAQSIHLGDIEEWHPEDEIEEVDVIIGGPPCQGFSLARGTRFLDDPRNHLYKDFVRLVEYYNPQWFVMENVQGIMNIGGGVIFQQILEDFEAIGFQVECRVVNMAEYGVPQLRKRAVFVGNRMGIDFQWPTKTNVKKVQKTPKHELELPNYNSVNSALSDLPLPIGNYFSHRANAQMRGPRNRIAETEPAYTLRVRGDEFALCEEPALSAFIPGDAPAEPVGYNLIETPLQEFFRHRAPEWIEQQNVVGKNERNTRVLRGTRKLTLRESARLQTFPDWVKFQGRRTSQAKQIGNAVPPLFGYYLFRQIFSYMD